MKKINICEKIFNFIKNLFNKKEIQLIESSRESNYDIKNNIMVEISKENKILKMQRDYENGKLKERYLSVEERESLIDLYKKQIETLETDISMKRKELNSYKEKILKAKKI